ncbi:MAG: type II secretion system GspH family protein [Alphaproteobacteria bacterium]|nr:type II secretion system GspH family protein [Alphaproteobacteria bacterium]
MNHKRLNTDGFTLVELSIVLIIIGLLTGGVLVGSSLLSSAEIRSVATAVDENRMAYYAFKERFNCLPGDCINADAYFDGATSGDGSGLIDCLDTGGASICTSTANEQITAIEHLEAAGLYRGISSDNDGLIPTNLRQCRLQFFNMKDGQLYDAPVTNYIRIFHLLDASPWNNDCMRHPAKLKF